MSIKLENDYAAYVISADGRNHHFIDKRTGVDYCSKEPESSFAQIKKKGKDFPASTALFSGDRLTLVFGNSGAQATLKTTAERHYFLFEVLEVIGKEIEELTFANLRLNLKGTPDEPFAGCALALNLKTNVPELPRANNHLRAICYPRFGFNGAKVAIIGCPQENLRKVMQEVVIAAPDLPHSSIGGPWALDAEINKGSYLFNFGGMSETTVDDWIRLAKTVGINQIDFHGGNSFRFGDCMPNPETYPRGRASLKAVIDKLHAAGILAGLHTYAFFIEGRNG